MMKKEINYYTPQGFFGQLEFAPGIETEKCEGAGGGNDDKP
jgi:hypothetical protein